MVFISIRDQKTPQGPCNSASFSHTLNHPPQGLFPPSPLRRVKTRHVAARCGQRMEKQDGALSFPQAPPVVSLLLLQSVLLSSCHYFRLFLFLQVMEEGSRILRMDSRCCARKKYQGISQEDIASSVLMVRNGG